MSAMVLPTFDEFFSNPAIARQYPLYVGYSTENCKNKSLNVESELRWDIILKCMSTMTLKDTAKRLRMSKYFVKQICKEHNIYQWPFKKLPTDLHNKKIKKNKK